MGGLDQSCPLGAPAYQCQNRRSAPREYDEKARRVEHGPIAEAGD